MSHRTALVGLLASLLGSCRRSRVPTDEELEMQATKIRNLIAASDDLVERHVRLQNSGPGNFLTLTVETLGQFADRAAATKRLDELMRQVGEIVDYGYPRGQASFILICPQFEVGTKDVGFNGHLVTFAELHERYP